MKLKEAFLNYNKKQTLLNHVGGKIKLPVNSLQLENIMKLSYEKMIKEYVVEKVRKE